MPTPPLRAPAVALLIALGLLTAGCGKARREPVGVGPVRRVAPVATQGAVSLTTSNTARVGGADVAIDAAAVARVVYSGLTATARPQLVVLVNERDWPAALAASSLSAAPTRAPILYSEGNATPTLSREALIAMHPTGGTLLSGAQVLRIGSQAAVPGGLEVHTLPFVGPAVTAAVIERLAQAAGGGSPPKQVIVVPLNAPRALQMPAAGLAAQSGAPILYSSPGGLPAATRSILADLHHPSIYVLNPLYAGKTSLGQLAQLGRVTQISAGASASAEGEGPVRNAIAVARFTDGTFGWGIKEPGHGLVFASAGRPLDAPAAAVLAATGDYAPLLLVENPYKLPAALSTFLGDIQPAYASAPEFRPVRGVYNHGWLLGDERAISAVTQSELDALLEISPSKQPNQAEASVVQAE